MLLSKFGRRGDPVARANAGLRQVERQLRRHSRRYLKQVGPLLDHADLAQPALLSIQGLSRLCDEVRRLRNGRSVTQQSVVIALNQLQAEAAVLTADLRGSYTAGPRAALAEAQRLLCCAVERVGEDAEPQIAPKVKGPTVSIHPELLFQAMQSLFPPERMALIAGRQNIDGVCLTGMFDVTGTGPDTHEFHVQAESQSLARALISMELSGSHFAGWIHSHPGRGPEATHPSPTDLSQYQTLLANYSPDLICVIVVADRFVRFWGTPVDKNRLNLNFVGEGIERVAGGKHVYRLQG